jgi:nucleoid-associated protein YgaU
MTADLSTTGGQAAQAAKWVKAKPTRATPAIGAAGIGASLRKLEPTPRPGEVTEVKFAINPERISVSHTLKTEGATGTTFEDQIKSLGYIEIAIDKVLMFGAGTQSDIDTLISWSAPSPVTIGVRMQQKYARPVLLQFMWGTGLNWQVYLRQVTATYLRFADQTGVPIRAEVRLNLYRTLTTKMPPRQNPTSGGPPGRSSHVLDSSECLASLAETNYGRPGAWRRIAQANSIDDPLRVRPGTTVYLPEPGEPGPLPGGRP